jgi:hypothetical protein
MVNHQSCGKRSRSVLGRREPRTIMYCSARCRENGDEKESSLGKERKQIKCLSGSINCESCLSLLKDESAERVKMQMFLFLI